MYIDAYTDAGVYHVLFITVSLQLRVFVHKFSPQQFQQEQQTNNKLPTSKKQTITYSELFGFRYGNHFGQLQQ